MYPYLRLNDLKKEKKRKKKAEEEEEGKKSEHNRKSAKYVSGDADSPLSLC